MLWNSRCSLSLWFAGNWQEELELWWKFVFGIESIGEVNTTDTAVGVDLHAKGLNVVSTVCSACKVWQVKLDLIPAFIKSHWHGANERFDSSCALIVRCSESSADTLVIKNLDLEREVFLQLYIKIAGVRIWIQNYEWRLSDVMSIVFNET
jgi:hypothetical protein